MNIQINHKERDRLERLIADKPTTAAKIRTLAEAGMKRADIARFLEIRYQWVRNVLVSDEEKKRAERNATEDQVPPQPTWAQVGTDGRVLIPAPFRQALGIEGGGHVLMRFEDGELRLISRDAAIARTQELVAKYVPEKVSLVDALLSERRREVERETRDG